ncbi:MAG: nucleotidyl transferase AbiEii/AbiGii toxin family protein [Candidatus Omnitrophota bacterium]
MLELKEIESFYPEYLRPFKANILREYLQYKMLEAVYSSEFAGQLVFMGGTAIHIAHGLPRFSEDLDFDNRGLDKKSFEALSQSLVRKLRLEGYKIELSVSFGGAYRAYIKFIGLLQENKLSSHKAEKLLIQLDTEPQRFDYKPGQIILNKFDVFTRIDIIPEDILLSQKIYAIFARKRPMGRDFYDAIFLFGKTGPNFDYLKSKSGISAKSILKERLLKKCEDLDFKLLAGDIEKFLFKPEDAKKVLLFREFIKSL